MRKMINFDFLRHQSPAVIGDPDREADTSRKPADHAARGVARRDRAHAGDAAVQRRRAWQARMKAVAIEREKMRQRERERLARGVRRFGCATPKQYMQSEIVDQFNLTKGWAGGRARQAGARRAIAAAAPYVAFLFFRMVTPIVAFGLSAVLRVRHPEAGTSRPMIKLGMCLVAAYVGMLAAERLPQEPDPEAPAVDQARLPRRARPAADLRRVRHVDRGRLPQGRSEIGTQSMALAEELDADHGGTVLPAGPQGRLREPRQAHRPGGREIGVHGAAASRSATARRSGQTLRVMAQENRDMRMSEAEKKAAALPPKLTVPMRPRRDPRDGESSRSNLRRPIRSRAPHVT